jgi:hypothetical protein
MKRTSIGGVVIALALAASSGARGVAAAPADNAAEPIIETGDVDRFYKVYDEAEGRPTAEALQHDYIDPGSDGLHELARLRNVTGQSIAEAIAKRPEIYSEARGCIDVLPRGR